MVFRQPESEKRDRPAGRSLLLLVIYFLIGLFVGQFVALLCSMAFFGLGLQETEQIAGNLQHPHARWVLFLFQFFGALGGFVIASLVYLYRHQQQSLSTLFNKRGWAIIPLVLTILITVAFMMANSIVIEWNANITLPETFKSFESMARQKEEYLQRLTDFLTTFPSTLDFVVAFLIIALLPAFGEELFFRGLMQPLIQRKLGNPHVAIWLTAFIFSAFHFQFYGLLPRLFLGALFGYLYYWSGNLLMPVIGHFINNGLSLLLRYLYQLELIGFDSNETDAVTGTTVAIFLLVGIVAVVVYRQYFNREAWT